MPRLRLSSNLTEHNAGRYYNSPSKVPTTSVNTEMHSLRAGKPQVNTYRAKPEQYKVSSKLVNTSTASAVGR